MGENRRCHSKLYAITMIASLLLSGCSISNNRNCRYEPIRGSVVVNSTEEPLVVSFTPDSEPHADRFRQYNIDMSRLHLSLHKQSRDLKPGQRYDAIVNIRTTGQCTPYVVYLLR